MKINGFFIVTSLILFLILIMLYGIILKITKSEKYTFSRTMGLWGQPEPAFCYETTPVPPYNICRAGSLACSSNESWKDYEECVRKLQ